MDKKARIYAVVNRKGGVGKTTTAVTLGHGLAKKIAGEGHVLIVDLDPQGNVATSLGLSVNGRDIADVLTGEAPVEEAILHADRSQVGGPARPNLWVLPASDALADAKLTLVANAALTSVLDQFGGRAVKAVPTDQLLQTHLSKAVATFDYIILDCPPSLDMLGTAIYHFADEAVVPVKVDYLGVGGTARHTQDIIQAQAEGIDIRVGVIVPTFVRAREILARQMMRALVDSYGKSRVAVPIPQSVVVEQAPAAGGLTVFEYAPGSVPAQAYWRLVEKVYHG
ncbi:MAG TPA: ParA family protein [Anaerolineae bacterium]|jgi:chromosome partitioning protein|nr:ParA family protein [Anaerolineae bacterium]